ncbi:Uu.00g075830.m01.CDS01 [Anthostomella pinea]|uniref:Uu.00g075830.m01.CDS01 n=1 Tax=Anthostomella pinea TaxID=933095 RepID=A0AAI8YP54_9PEZI|nr:Uu.00g075830.m01.CDS01 [Anthostomella pinea]
MMLYTNLRRPTTRGQVLAQDPVADIGHSCRIAFTLTTDPQLFAEFVDLHSQLLPFPMVLLAFLQSGPFRTVKANEAFLGSIVLVHRDPKLVAERCHRELGQRDGFLFGFRNFCCTLGLGELLCSRLSRPV